jgi:hypothetical protein
MLFMHSVAVYRLTIHKEKVVKLFNLAWANLSSSFVKMGKRIEALSTLEQALVHNENNWRMW